MSARAAEGCRVSPSTPPAASGLGAAAAGAPGTRSATGRGWGAGRAPASPPSPTPEERMASRLRRGGWPGYRPGTRGSERSGSRDTACEESPLTDTRGCRPGPRQQTGARLASELRLSAGAPLRISDTGWKGSEAGEHRGHGPEPGRVSLLVPACGPLSEAGLGSLRGNAPRGPLGHRPLDLSLTCQIPSRGAESSLPR